MDRPQAERLLKEDGREGVYLVRRSNQANCYTVGIFTKESRPDCGIVRHYHIKTNERGQSNLSYLPISYSHSSFTCKLLLKQ